jgi:hypothetical protein
MTDTAAIGRIEGTPLAGQHAAITGATRGIGAAIADTLARLGADLTLMGRNTKLLASSTQRWPVTIAGASRRPSSTSPTSERSAPPSRRHPNTRRSTY